MIYYETVERDGVEFYRLVAHDTFEEAMNFAEEHGIETILEIHDVIDAFIYEEYVRCSICRDWVVSNEISEDGLCAACERAGRDHGF